MKYRIIDAIVSARGTQEYIVDASSEDEAREKHLRGESEFDHEEIEVTETEHDEVRIDD